MVPYQSEKSELVLQQTHQFTAMDKACARLFVQEDVKRGELVDYLLWTSLFETTADNVLSRREERG